MNKILFSLILFLIIILLVCFFCCKRVDNFTDLSCENEQKQIYTPQELIFKSQCPNLVILLNNNGLYSVEPGDENGPLFTHSSQYDTYYHMGESPEGHQLVPVLEDYELWYYPRYNPIRWFSGPWRYRDRRPFWRRPWRRPWRGGHWRNRDGHWRNRDGHWRNRDGHWRNRNSGLTLQSKRNRRKSPARSPAKSTRKTVAQGASARL